MKKLISILILSAGCANTQLPFSNVIGENPAASRVTQANVLSVSVSACDVNNDIANEPCTSVTICQHGTGNCQTIPNILIDTGSSGLRLFSNWLDTSEISHPLLALTPEHDGSGNQIMECLDFGSNSAWGPVMMADVYLGSESPVYTPIQEFNYNYSAPPSDCVDSTDDPALKTPSKVGYNGILGIGLFAQDCGSDCTVTGQTNDTYFYCSGSNCTNSYGASLTAQLQNPVALLPIDNNGVILQFPGVSSSGASSVSGTLIFGISTAANNIPGAQVSLYQADGSGNFGSFTTSYSGQTYDDTSFIDSGSNGLFFPAVNNAPATCADNSGFYCPTTNVGLAATIVSIPLSGHATVQTTIGFQIGNADNLLNSGNAVFNNLGGPVAVGLDTYPGFDWGFPFFLGRTIYVGFEGKTAGNWTGPYWAF